MRKYPAIFLLMTVVAVLSVSFPVFAHHGNTAYDMTKSVSVKGTVTDFKFINPHVLIFIDAKNDKGETEQWQGELTSPNHLERAGWNPHTLKPGDTITLIGSVSKSGAHSMWLSKVLGPDGQPMNMVQGD